MTGIPPRHLLAAFLGAALLGSGASSAQNPPPDQPAVTVKGQTYTPQSILARNMGTAEDQTTLERMMLDADLAIRNQHHAEIVDGHLIAFQDTKTLFLAHKR